MMNIFKKIHFIRTNLIEFEIQKKQIATDPSDYQIDSVRFLF